MGLYFGVAFEYYTRYYTIEGYGIEESTGSKARSNSRSTSGSRATRFASATILLI